MDPIHCGVPMVCTYRRTAGHEMERHWWCTDCGEVIPESMLDCRRRLQQRLADILVMTQDDDVHRAVRDCLDIVEEHYD